MQKLQDRHGYAKVSRALRFPSIRLHSKPETESLAKEIDVERERLDNSNDLHAALESGRRAYNKLYPRLSLLFESKSFIETFFVHLLKSDKSDAEVSEEQPAAAEA